MLFGTSGCTHRFGIPGGRGCRLLVHNPPGGGTSFCGSPVRTVIFWDLPHGAPGLGPDLIGHRTACPANTAVRTSFVEAFIVRGTRGGGGGSHGTAAGNSMHGPTPTPPQVRTRVFPGLGRGWKGPSTPDPSPRADPLPLKRGLGGSPPPGWTRRGPCGTSPPPPYPPPPLVSTAHRRPDLEAPARDALEGKGPERRPQRRLGRRLEEVAEAVGGGYCRLRMPLKRALGVRETVAGRRLGVLEGGGGTSPLSNASLAPPPKAPPVLLRPPHAAVRAEKASAATTSSPPRT